jgi:hypothetical protein
MKELELPECTDELMVNIDTDVNANFNETSFGFYLYPEEFKSQYIKIEFTGVKSLFVCPTNSSSRENIEGTCDIMTASAYPDENEELHRHIFIRYRNDKVSKPAPFIWVAFRLLDLSDNDSLLLKLNSRYRKIKFIQFNEDTFKYDVLASFENCESSLKFRLHDRVQ